jgi:hypothetical protein
MNSNVMTWKSAVESGLEPRDYPFAAAEIPMGVFEAKLEFKIWAKLENTVSCFFTEVATGRKFQLSVFRRKTDEVYAVAEGDVDFHTCPADTVYLITVRTNDRDKAVLQRAELVG